MALPQAQAPGERVLLQAIVVAAIAGLASLLVPNRFTVSTVLLPPDDQTDMSGLLSGGQVHGHFSRVRDQLAERD